MKHKNTIPTLPHITEPIKFHTTEIGSQSCASGYKLTARIQAFVKTVEDANRFHEAVAKSSFVLDDDRLTTEMLALLREENEKLKAENLELNKELLLLGIGRMTTY